MAKRLTYRKAEKLLSEALLRNGVAVSRCELKPTNMYGYDAETLIWAIARTHGRITYQVGMTLNPDTAFTRANKIADEVRMELETVEQWRKKEVEQCGA